MTNPILWAAVVLALTTFTVETAFVQVVTCKALLKRGLLSMEMRIGAIVWLIVGYPADFVFNLVRGCLMFREINPHGWLFSWRIDWYMRNPARCKRIDTAVRWGALLNTLDPGHTYWPQWAQARAVELGIRL